jgi:L,D-peptidoglycan transpeptidase YkuD (ErfK/YbiS/YcfS/YnhG family)
MSTFSRYLSLLIATLSTSVPAASSAADLPWSDARQLVLVTTSDWNADHGVLQTFAMSEGGWQPAADAIPVTIGREGSAWGIGLHPAQPGPQKREGDGRSPAGVFRIGNAFGYADSAKTALQYDAMTSTDYCIDVSDSPLYNRIVDKRVVGDKATEGTTEPMRRDIHVDGDHRYKLGFIIEHNSRGVAGLGSCIFAHIWKASGVPTAGCTAMDEGVMRALLTWVDAQQHPIFVLLPRQEYARLQAAWRMPEITLSAPAHSR